LKIEIGSAMPMAEPLRARVGDVEVSSNDVAEAIQAPLAEIVAAILAVLGEVPPRIAEGLRDRGLVLSGGGAQLRGIDRLIAERVCLPTAVTPEPQTSVVRGTGLALDNFEVLKRNQTYLR
jgi:rod shape-determining protein MreB